jgi:hypothetical protein
LANELKTEQERVRNSSQAAAQLAEAKLAHALEAEAAKDSALPAKLGLNLLAGYLMEQVWATKNF